MLVIAKLDRLARNVHFIAGLMNSDVEFVAVDMPSANRLTIHILAAVAEHEREMISQRTNAALAAAKTKGITLGNPRIEEARRKAAAALRTRPATHVLSLIKTLRGQGKSYCAIAKELNRLNIKTHRGCQWYDVTVKKVLVPPL